jgi:N-acetylneuraminic acid mutarotase
MDGLMVRFLSLTLAFLMAITSSAYADGRWQEGARMDAPRAGLSVVVLDGVLYAAGGSGLLKPRVEFESYSLDMNRWMMERALPQGLERFGMAVVNGRIYAAGGFSRELVGSPTSAFEVVETSFGPTAKMWSWSVDSGVWQSEAAMPGPKADFELVGLGDRLYAIGGEHDDSSIYIFDSETQIWETFSVPEGVTRRGAAAVVVDDKIYFIGGQFDGATSDRVDIYDPENNTWSQGQSLPNGRSGISAAYYHGRVHVLGGRGENHRTTLSEHASLAPGDHAWTLEAELLSPRTAADAVVLENEIYLVGGGSGGGFFAPFTALDATDIFKDDAAN